ncbi:MAG: hypothetical protein K8F91_01690, partial [Candidatus Obscuribacterales bacterium]|nr:hypothetical protein [Candidatus Obscuribacterales bacterium]
MQLAMQANSYISIVHTYVWVSTHQSITFSLLASGRIGLRLFYGFLYLLKIVCGSKYDTVCFFAASLSLKKLVTASK